MTVVRRELPPSQGARVAGEGVAEVEPRTLQSCLHRPGAAGPREAHSLSVSGAVADSLRRDDRGVDPGHRRPEKADQFAGDGDDRDRGALAVSDQMPVASVEPLLRFPGLGHDVPGLALDPPGDGAAEAGAVAIVPGRLDEDAPHMSVPGFGDPALALGVARGEFARHQAHVGHQLAGRAEALEIDELGQQDHRPEGVDAPEAAQPAHGLAVGEALGQALDFPVQLGQARLGLLDREQGGVQGALQFRHREPLGPEPRPVGLPPVGAGAIDAAMPEQELDEPMAPANDVLANIVAAAQQVAHRFLRLVRHVDRGQLARSVEADELGRVAAIRLDPP